MTARSRRDFYNEETYESLRDRFSRLASDARPAWGRMNAAQMLAHCSEVAEVSNGKPLLGTPWYIRLLGGLVKRMVLSRKPYPRGARTHPQFEIDEDVSFEEERERLLAVLDAIYSAGRAGAAANVHPIFGPMSAEEKGWLTYKHLDHHLTQFGV